jgi:hypothetical protein
MTDRDRLLFDRALGILFRFTLERTGWRRFFGRWYHSDEPLRNDAARLVREVGYVQAQPDNTRRLDATERGNG